MLRRREPIRPPLAPLVLAPDPARYTLRTCPAGRALGSGTRGTRGTRPTRSKLDQRRAILPAPAPKP
eukprot:10518194-Lingulodinium_polyedra.AAC.1